MSYHGRVEKTMEAESTGLLSHLIQTALDRVREENKFDIVMFLGIDGRIFCSSIPNLLDSAQYQLLNMVKENLPHICSQLATKNLLLSMQRYETGSMIISGVGDKAFLVFLMTSELDVANLGPIAKKVLNTSVVVHHLMELKPITIEATKNYDEEVSTELRKLSRLLFVEKFDSTRQYKKNMEVHMYLREELGQVLERGLLDEVITMAYNEVGTSAAYMNDRQWESLLGLILEEVRKLCGDVVADRCSKKWKPEVERLLRSFV
jgi:hypothetical protein